MQAARERQFTCEIVTKVGPHDILLGRGTGPNENPGNKVFRDILRHYKPIYCMAMTRKRKKQVLLDVLRTVKSSGGRFLEKNPVLAGETYRRVTDSVAFLKVRQAFRYLLRKKVVNEETDEGSATSCRATPPAPIVPPPISEAAGVVAADSTAAVLKASPTIFSKESPVSVQSGRQQLLHASLSAGHLNGMMVPGGLSSPSSGGQGVSRAIVPTPPRSLSAPILSSTSSFLERLALPSVVAPSAAHLHANVQHYYNNPVDMSQKAAQLRALGDLPHRFSTMNTANSQSSLVDRAVVATLGLESMVGTPWDPLSTSNLRDYLGAPKAAPTAAMLPPVTARLPPPPTAPVALAGYLDHVRRGSTPVGVLAATDPALRLLQLKEQLRNQSSSGASVLP